jgi:hypothetical protein
MREFILDGRRGLWIHPHLPYRTGSIGWGQSEQKMAFELEVLCRRRILK